MSCEIAGLVLAGGNASRMGYINKGALMLHSKSMVELVIEAIQPQVGRLFISANDYVDYYQQFPYPVFKDIRPGFLGPLAGIESVLTNVEDIEWLFCTPIDTPFIPTNLASQLLDAVKDAGAKCALPVNNGLQHSLHCLVHASLLPSLTEYLDSGGRSVGLWLKQCGTIEVEIKAEPKAFININTPDDLNSAQ